MLESLTIWVIPVLFAITVHEAAHGWVAWKRGDSTARDAGRLTLNPLPHIDPVGTVLLPSLLLLVGGVVFGWAKPVPVNARRLKRLRLDMAMVALAGPGANLLMAVFWAGVIHAGLIAYQLTGDGARWLVLMGAAGMQINVILCVLNLLPLPPLDGGRVLMSTLPTDLTSKLQSIEWIGIPILLLLFVLGWLGPILYPAFNYLLGWIAAIADIPPQLFSFTGFS